MQSGSKYTRSLLENYGDKLSDFVQQNGSLSDFNTSESWVILTPIEQSIKRKIEAVGTPLKDWDIQINYGIKTGFNDAFIISTEKREEILANCADEEERTRTDELIRPILRGRDIKRYGYDWAGLYLIATFPSRHYDIEQYPAVKQHLLSFGMERLEQTGKEYVINGVKIKARKKTNNKWFETQDSISYWDDFSQPKIVWKRVGSILRFGFDEKKHFGLDSTCFMLSSQPHYLCLLLNSPIGHYLLKNAPQTGTGDLLISVQAVEPLAIPIIDVNAADRFKELLIDNVDETKVNALIYQLYGLSSQEIQFIESLRNQ